MWTTVPLALAVVTLAVLGVAGHQSAMRDLVESRDARAVRMAAGRLSDRLQMRTDALAMLAEQVADGGPSALNPHFSGETVFQGGITVVDPPATILATWPAGWDWTPRIGAVDALFASGQEGSLRISPVIDDPLTGERLFLLARPANKHWLVAAITLGELGLQPLVSELAIGTQVRASVADSDSHVLAASASTPRFERGSPGPLPKDIEGSHRREAGAVTTSVSGVKTVVAYAPVEPVGWVLVTQEPWDAVVGPLMRFSLVAPLLLLLAALAAGLTVAFGLQAIVRPLQQLDEQAARVAWGDFDAVQTPVGGAQEFEDLRQTLYALAQQIRRYQKGMRDYIGAITRAQEEERRRLARELHDDTIQALIALGHRVEMAKRQLEHNPHQAAERLDELKELIHDTVSDVRRFTRALRPIYLEDLGLQPALEMLVRDAGAKSEIEVSLHITGPSRRLTEELELAIYRIAQEALGNVAQHSNAQRADVRLHYTPDEVTLTVVDDGVGFEVPSRPEELAQRGHFGLVGMHERAALVGGRLEIISSPGEGTQVQVVLPTEGE
jgi:signal transduction histidine kinase